MNKQDTLNYVYQKLIEQGGQSIESDGFGCCYRGPGGRKCAAGWLIPDDKYDVDMEGVSCFPDTIVYDVIKECGYNPEFVYKLQVIHDDYAPINGSWKEYLDKKLAELAKRENLEFKA